MSTPVNKTVNIYINQGSAEKALESLNARADRLSKSIERGRKQGKDMTDQLNKLDETKKKITELTSVMDGKMAPSLRMLRSHAKDLKRELESMSEDAPGYAAKFREFEKVSGSLQTMENKIRSVGRTMDSVAPKAGGFLTNIKGIAAGTLIGNAVQSAMMAMGQYISGMISGNAKLSDSLADVRKATGLSADEVRKLNSELKNIDTRTKAAELREIAIGLGQIGEAATAENVANIDKIVVALGDEFGGGAREITTVLGVLRNNLKDIQTNNYGDDVLHIGNALNVLGAEGLATAPVVTDFANRMAGIGGAFGVTSGQILGLAAAMQELGIAPERGATAFNRLLQKMTADVDSFSKIAQQTGISAKDFAQLVDKDIVAALLKVAEGSRIAGDSNAAFGKVLKGLDADGSGAGEVLSKLAANSELVGTKVSRATVALKESGSIIEEFTTKNTNLAASLDKLGKWFSSKIFSSTIADGLNSLVTGFAKLVGAIDSTTLSLQELEAETKALDKLEEQITPLIADYDELSKKGKLSREEQERLKTAIDGIAGAVPLAATEIDQYGRVLDVSTAKAKEFIKYQKLALQEKNRAAIKGLTDDVQEQAKQATTRISNLEHVIARGQAQVAKYGQEHAKQMSEMIASAREDSEQALDALRGKVALLAETSGKTIAEVLNDLPTPEPTWFQALLGGPAALRKFRSAKDLLGDDFKQSADATTEPDTKDPRKPIPTLTDEEKRLEQHRQTVLSKIASLKAEVEAMAKDETNTLGLNHEQQVNDVKQKYQKLIEEAIKYGVNIAQINEVQAKELDMLVKKQMSERDAKEYELSLQNLDDFHSKQRAQAGELYASGTIDHEQYNQRMLSIDKDLSEDRLTVMRDYANNVIKAQRDLTKASISEKQRLAKEDKKIESQAAASEMYKAERAVLTSKAGSQAQLDARINLIKLSFDKEIELARDSKDKQLLLEQEKNIAIAAARKESFDYWVQQATAALSSIQGVFNTYFNYLSQKDQVALAKDKAAHDTKKKNLDKQLDAKMISQAEYNRRVETLDQEYAKKARDAKRREFNRNKAIQIAEATMNLGLAIANVWSKWAALPPAAAAMQAIAMAAVGAQIGIIAASKFPEYRQGGKAGYTGIPDGPSHEAGGLDLINSQTGQKIGEMEGGEPIISRETYRNNKALVDALLYAGMYEGGRNVTPGWIRNMPAQINTGRFDDFQRMFNNGGVSSAGQVSFAQGTGTTGSPLFGLDKETVEALKAFTKVLSKPLEANVSFQKLRDKQKTYEEIRKAGSLKRN